MGELPGALFMVALPLNEHTTPSYTMCSVDPLTVSDGLATIHSIV